MEATLPEVKESEPSLTFTVYRGLEWVNFYHHFPVSLRDMVLKHKDNFTFSLAYTDIIPPNQKQR